MTELAVTGGLLCHGCIVSMAGIWRHARNSVQYGSSIWLFKCSKHT